MAPTSSLVSVNLA